MDKSSKIGNFRGRVVKEATVKSDAAFQTVQQVQQMVIALSGQLYKLHKQVEGMNSILKITDYRTLGIMKALNKGNALLSHIPSEQDVVKEVQKLQLVQFEREADDKDKADKLSPALDGASAQAGDVLRLTLSLFKEGKELEDQRILRSRLELGKKELLAEVDEAAVGMKIGESKRFPINIQGMTDEAELTILDIKIKPAPESTAPESTATP